ncbi:MAG: EI24 domain-containing protein [Chitinophagaceae bacterium]|nr:EI24 domain-containing protein [Chitinophagaceae bacterium]MBL0054639.1 EI24 domain-containing protein [Chitinophagaceae bacterium]
MLKEIIISIQAYMLAHRFIMKHRLWKWIIIPGLIYGILFFLGIYLFWISSSSAIELMLVKTGIKEWMQRMQSSWLSFLLIFGQVILHLILMMFYLSLFKYLFLIIGSPLFAYLSEKTESIIEGKDIPFDMKQFLKDIFRGIRLAFRNMLWQTVYTISILILSFIPLLGWITPLIALITECYYLGFSMLDYSCERNKLSTSQSIAFISRHKGLAIGNGLVFVLMHLLPFIGWILAPSYAVIAATISLYNTKTDNPVATKEIT